MDRVEAMRCLHGSRQKQQRLDRIRAAKAALEAEVRLEPSMADSDGPVHPPECRLMAGPIGRPMADRPRERSATLPIPTAVYCLRETDSLLVTTVSSRLMPRTKSSSHTV
jgi:hypothetical protein